MNMVNFNKGRASIYNFLASAYMVPADSRFVSTAREYLPYFQILKEEIPSLAEGVDGLTLALENEINEQDFIVAHTRLFSLGVCAGSIASSESVYTSDLELAMQEVCERIKHFYSLFGFDMPANFKEAEDHIAAELLFMAFLADKFAYYIIAGDKKGVEKYMKAQKDLMQTHLLRWVPEFCNLLISKADEANTLLVCMSKMLEAYLAHDADFLRGL